MLNIVILIAIIVALIIHRYLTSFWEQGRLPYSMGFLIFANTLIVLYLINFIWMFGVVVGIILSVLTFLQLVYATLLWPFLLPWLIGTHKKNDIPRVGPLVYGAWSFIVLGVGALTILNFFISGYMSLLKSIMAPFNESYFLLVGGIIGIAITSNIIRIFIMKKMVKL